MSKLAPRRLPFIRLLLLCGSLSCTDPEQPVGHEDGTTGTSTTPDVLTTAPDTPTTTQGDSTTSLGDDGPMTTTSTSDDPETDSDVMGTTAAGPECGNGALNDGEECDDGLDGNADTRYCKADCTLNVCGDEKLFVGWELCDEGAGNSDAYGSLCGEGCAPGARCGDHKLQPEFETCDLGLENGGRKGDDQGILFDTSCKAQQLRGFVTKESFTGAMGGLFGADLKCQAAAKFAGLAEPERFRAYDGLAGAEIAGETEIDAAAAGLTSFNTVVRVPSDAGKTGSNPIHFDIVAVDNPDIKVREKAAFLLPQ